MSLWSLLACSLGVLTLCHASDQVQIYEAEYNHLYSLTEDKDGLESIRALHQQVQNNKLVKHNGTFNLPILA